MECTLCGSQLNVHVRSIDDTSVFCEICFFFVHQPDPTAVFLHVTQPGPFDDIRFRKPARHVPDLYAQRLPPAAVETEPALRPVKFFTPRKELQAPTQTPRMYVLCDQCDGEIPLGSRRFRCADCFNFDLCQGCFSAHRVNHNPHHAFYVCCSGTRVPQRNLFNEQIAIDTLSLSDPEVAANGLMEEAEQLELTAFGDSSWGIHMLQNFDRPDIGSHVKFFVARNKDTRALELVAILVYRFEGGDTLHIMSVAVKRTWHGCGLGKFIMTHALRQAEAAPRCRAAKLNVDQRNEAALALYLQLDFEVLEEIPRYYNGVRDAYLMRRVIAQRE